MSPPTYVYRGVHGKHKMRASALKGTVIPGDPKGEVTPEEHNMLNESGISPFTSWTYSKEIAQRFARSRGSGGVVLRLVIDNPGPYDTWSWQESPDYHREQEVLLRGVRIDAEVIDDE